MGKRRKIYNPNRKTNPVVQAKKLEMLSKDFSELKNMSRALSKSHDNHISYLGNFARHDIKNAILSMDSILTTTEPEEFDKDVISSLSGYLKVIKNTMDNFTDLVPYSSNGTFKISTLFTAIRALTRADMQKDNIDLILVFDKESKEEINFPFQTMLQIIHNLIINSIKALGKIESKKIYIEGYVEDKNFIVTVSDNGREIQDEEKEKMFEYGYSNTGGSGIGLFHAKYLCTDLNGDIDLFSEPKKNMSKTFCITLPLLCN